MLALDRRPRLDEELCEIGDFLELGQRFPPLDFPVGHILPEKEPREAAKQNTNSAVNHIGFSDQIVQSLFFGVEGHHEITNTAKERGKIGGKKSAGSPPKRNSFPVGPNHLDSHDFFTQGSLITGARKTCGITPADHGSQEELD